MSTYQSKSDDELKKYIEAATRVIWEWISSIALQRAGEQLDQEKVMFCKDTFLRWSKELDPTLKRSSYCSITTVSGLVEVAELIAKIQDQRVLAKYFLSISEY